MVRRGSTVRVRQRALQKPRTQGAFLFGSTCRSPGVGQVWGPLWSLQVEELRLKGPVRPRWSTVKSAWVEYLGEHPEPAIDRVQEQDADSGDDRLRRSVPDVVENAASDGADEGDSQTRMPRRVEGGAGRSPHGKLDHKLQRSRDCSDSPTAIAHRIAPFPALPAPVGEDGEGRDLMRKRSPRLASFSASRPGA
jgi:hypothetical protein